ncbi:Transcription factor 25 [Nymphaea thermarum]|nr:Transcription factor 25 [Nymphaea thermarum]
MSARMLRRFLADQEQKEKNPADSKQEEHDDSDSPVQCAPSGNPFDLLDDQEDEPGVSHEFVAHDDVEQTVSSESFSRTTAGNRKSKKKKKPSKVNPVSTKSKQDKDVDILLKELSMDRTSQQFDLSNDQVQSEMSKSCSSNVKVDCKKQHSLILSVEPKFLKAENELRRIFGSKVVSSFENSYAGVPRQVHGGRRGSHSHRKTILVAPSNHWPHWDGSLSMDLLETKDGEHFFRYTHSSSYEHAQQIFEAAKAAHDINTIASILLHHPYHIESLLTIADVLKFSGEHQSSADAIGKCLYALECAWHSLFNPMQGNCRLKYSHDTNKPVFTVLFQHMQNLNRRGCHRSALEVCKLLLSLDPDDPMGALFCIDYFSLRAEEYDWLEKFVDVYKSDNSLWLFPNFSYSLPICHFYLEQNGTSKGLDKVTEKATSGDLMEQALMLHPLILKKLVAKAPLKDVAWTKILKHSFFSSCEAGSPSLEHLINIYVERNFIMWRIPDLQKLLKEAALCVIEYSHLLVSDFSDSVPTIPPDDLRQFMIDPRALVVDNNAEQVQAAGGGMVPREVLNRNPVMVFLESMLPWVTYDSAGDADAAGEHHQNGD